MFFCEDAYFPATLQKLQSNTKCTHLLVCNPLLDPASKKLRIQQPRALIREPSDVERLVLETLAARAVDEFQPELRMRFGHGLEHKPAIFSMKRLFPSSCHSAIKKNHRIRAAGFIPVTQSQRDDSRILLTKPYTQLLPTQQQHRRASGGGSFTLTVTLIQHNQFISNHFSTLNVIWKHRNTKKQQGTSGHKMFQNVSEPRSVDPL